MSTALGSGGFTPWTGGGTLQKGPHPHQQAQGETMSSERFSDVLPTAPPPSGLGTTLIPRAEWVAPRRHGGSLVWSHLSSGSFSTGFFCLVDLLLSSAFPLPSQSLILGFKVFPPQPVLENKR